MFPFDFAIPAERIAQQPCEPRDHARLLVARRSDQTLAHHHVFDLPEFLEPGDLLVCNDTRVLHARLLGHRARTGGKWEGLYLRSVDGQWEILCQTRGRLQAGERIVVAPGPLELTLVERLPDGRWRAQPSCAGAAEELLRLHGQVPIPPYIRKGCAEPPDTQRYQTVFASRPGAVAAPTAGLHFTPELLDRLQARGIDRAFVTLHVGLGTFQPIQVDDVRQHPMHLEWGQLDAQAVAKIEACRARKGRVVAVGTTAVRVLETVAQSGPMRPWEGETNLFVYPPYRFRQVDVLFTNFHLPRTTLLLLVAAFAGDELTRRAYEAALEADYRFYSYGDAMCIL